MWERGWEKMNQEEGNRKDEEQNREKKKVRERERKSWERFLKVSPRKRVRRLIRYVLT